MTSQIDPTLPVTGTPTTASVRGNFQTAHDEISALQALPAAPGASTTTPAMDGTAAIGTATTFARADHVHPSDTSRMPLAGVTNGSNAAAGQVGEYVAASQTTNLAMTNNTARNITSISLTAGDWDVSGFPYLAFSAAVGTSAVGVVTTTSGSVSPATYDAYAQINAGAMIAASLTIGPTRMSLAAITTVYLSAVVSFPSGTCNGQGTIRARRVR